MTGIEGENNQINVISFKEMIIINLLILGKITDDTVQSFDYYFCFVVIFKNQIDLHSWQFKGGGAKAWFLTPKI